MALKIKNVVLEGPDCCGKTTLYRNLHSATGYKHNIHDRSFLSALCYARLYGRSTLDTCKRNLLEDLCNANNFYVVILPPLETIIDRYHSRGDEFQNVESLTRLHGIFEEEVASIQHLPNVFVIRSVGTKEQTTSSVVEALDGYSSLSPASLGKKLSSWSILSPRKEVQFSVTFDVVRSECDPGILNDPREGEYYRSILEDCMLIIDDEIAGNNEYGKPQGLDSRRFYYSGNTCISSIHFLPRVGDLKVICTLRSTNAVENGEVDLSFLSYLAVEIDREYSWSSRNIELDVRFNSLHVIKKGL